MFSLNTTQSCTRVTKHVTSLKSAGPRSGSRKRFLLLVRYGTLITETQRRDLRLPHKLPPALQEPPRYVATPPFAIAFSVHGSTLLLHLL